MVCMRVKDGPNKGVVYSLNDDVVCIGRDTDVHIQIMDQGVSRRHAEIFRVGEMFFIRDLGSRNGTYVNDERISEELLRKSDRVRIGQTTLVFEDSVASKEEVVPQIEFSHVETDPGATMEFRFGVMDFADIEEPDTQKAQQVPQSYEPEHLSVLLQVARAVSKERDIREMLTKIIALCAEAVGADHGYIFAKARERDKRELNLEASYEKEDSGAPSVSTTIIKRVFKTGRALLTSDAAADQRFSSKSSVILKGVRSVICVPLVGRDMLLGVIYLSTSDPAVTLSSEDLELVSAIGIQAGMALYTYRMAAEQRHMFTSIITTLVNAVEMQKPSLKGRSERVAKFARAAARAMELPETEVNSVGLAALLHNIGMLSISDSDIIHSQETDSREEALEYKLAVQSEKLLGNIDGLREILPAVKHSFEYYDGSGYPEGLSGDEIPLNARIIAAAYAFERILGEGPQDKMSIKNALFKLNSMAQEGKIDPEVVKSMAIAFRMGLLED